MQQLCDSFLTVTTDESQSREAPNNTGFRTQVSDPHEDGMSSKQSRQALQRAIRQHCCYSLRAFLGLGSSPSKLSFVDNIVLVAIDFENLKAFKRLSNKGANCQLGLAILDTKDLLQPTPQELISVFNYATGNSTYLDSVSEKFGFSETVKIRRKEMLKHLENVIPRGRNVVLVGHDVIHDLLVLQHLGFNIDDRDTNIVGFLDTQILADQVLGDPELRCPKLSLASVLQELGCEYGELHNAGHDAYFTLRALLALALRRLSGEADDDEKRQERLQAFSAIVETPLPFPDSNQDINNHMDTNAPKLIAQYQKNSRRRRIQAGTNQEKNKTGGIRKHHAKPLSLEFSDQSRVEGALRPAGKAGAIKPKPWWDYLALLWISMGI